MVNGRYVRSKQFKKLKKVDPITLTYCIQTAWDLSNDFLSKFKTIFKNRRSTTDEDKDIDYFNDVKVEIDEKKTVIDNLQLSTERFTPKYLYAIN